MSTTPRVRIYQPAKTAMQSGKAKTHHWLLEFERPAPAAPDALMGWNTMSDTSTQVKLTFATKEDAVAYATAKNLPFTVKEPQTSSVAPKAYAENFSANRRHAFEANS